MAVLDITTGEFRATEVTGDSALRSELAAFAPREILLAEAEPGSAPPPVLTELAAEVAVNRLPAWVFEPDRAAEQIRRFFACASLESFGCAELPAAAGAAGAILHYLEFTQKGVVAHVRTLQTYHSRDFMVLDAATRRNLELTATIYDGSRKGSLLGVLDRTLTAMGGRKLRHWVHHPLVAVEPIRRRHQAVAQLVEQSLARVELRRHLDGIYDLERLSSRISMANANAKDLAALRSSLQRLPALRDTLQTLTSPLLSELAAAVDPLAGHRRVDRRRAGRRSALRAARWGTDPRRLRRRPSTNCAPSPAKGRAGSPASNSRRRSAPASPASRCASTRSSAITWR